MPRSLQSALSLISGTRDAIKPSIQTFPPVDVEQLAAELSIEERARKQGADGKPREDADSPDSEELRLGEEIERRARQAAEEYRASLELYDSRIRDAIITSELRVEVESAGESAVSDFSIRAVNDANHLAALEHEAKGRDAEYLAFRRKHRLERLPKVVTARERFFRGTVIGIFVVLESVLNGLFFAEGSEAGLIGGFVQAVVLSILNIGAAILFASYGMRLLIYRNYIVKAVGVLALLAYVAWLLGLNLAIAHFRDAYIASAGDVSAAVLWENFRSAPLVLSSAQSWLLALLGVGFSLSALISASGFDDRYLFYGEIGRAREEAFARFNNEKTVALEGFMTRRDEAVEQMTQVIAALRRQEYDKRLAIDGRNRLHRDFSAYLDHLAAAQQRLIAMYREANEEARSSAPPKYFRAAPWRPAFLEVPPLTSVPEIDNDAREAAVDRMRHFIKEVNSEMSKYGAAYRFEDLPRPSEEAHAASPQSANA
jgi:hypothetical protein